MTRTFLFASALAAMGTGAAASSIGFELTVSNLAFGPSVTNVPLMTLENTSTSAELTQFSLTIGDTRYNYDAVYFFTPPPGGTMSLIQGDMNDGNTSGNTVRVNEGIIGFTGFDAGESASWRVDVDIDNANTIEDYRTVLFNNGAAPNALFTAQFSNGMSLSVEADDQSASNTSFTFSASEDLSAVPLPAGLPMLLAGLGGFALIRRRKG